MKCKHTYLLSFFLVCITWLQLGAQENRDYSDKISDCDGATDIRRPGKYTMQFTGDGGYINDIAAYSSLSAVKEENSLWATFIAPYDGLFSLSASAPEEKIQLVVFLAETSDICGEIYDGVAEIERLVKNTEHDTIGLDKSMNPGYLYPIPLEKGQQIHLYFSTVAKSRTKLELNVKFEGEADPITFKELQKEVDQRLNPTDHYIAILLRDAETGLPVRANLIVKETRQDNALYLGSDFIFSAMRRGKFVFSVDAEGYFFYDREETLDGQSDHEVMIWLEPAYVGRKVELKGLEFRMGTTELLPSAESSLKRLRDFLMLNSEIRIEIQGHVHADGENTYAAQRMSLARAKRVQKYLIESGVDKNRLEVKGLGNEQMMFPNAKLISEEQANRRVEIEILQEQQ